MKPNRILAAVLCTVLAAAQMPAVPAIAAQPGRLYMTPLDTAAKENALRYGGMFITSSEGADETPSAALPAAYDLREHGLCTEVKDQGPYNTCWAFSSLNCLETNEIAHDPLVDLSEWYLAFATYADSFGYPYTADSPFDAGSYDCDQEVGILTGWLAPAAESIVQYGDKSIADTSPTAEEVRAEAVLHTTDAIRFPYSPGNAAVLDAQIASVKAAIYEGKALDISYVHSDACFNEATNAYIYNTEQAAGHDTFGHSVSIVGWDDAFPASNFLTDPGRDGAWLAKNSWGHSWGDNGYFWISYADPRIDDVCEFDAEAVQLHNRMYQHDQFGSSGAFSFSSGGDQDVQLANVFTAEANGWITSVMFCNLDPADTVSFTVYTGLEDAGNPVSGKASETTVKQFGKIGYQTVDLDKPVPVKAGEQFAVAARVTGERNDFRIPVEFATRTEQTHADGLTDVFDSGFTTEMLGRDFTLGQSFYSADGTVWYDMYNVEHTIEDRTDEASGESTHTEMILGNICLKVLTRDDGIVTFSDYHEEIPADEGIELANDDHAPIYYSFDGVEFTLYEEPLHFPEGQDSMTISAYADMGDKTLFTREYRKQKAAVSSILCKDGNFDWYADRDPDDPTRFHYYMKKGVTQVDILPMTTGTLTIGGETFPSGKTGTLAVKRGVNTFDLTIEQPGMETGHAILTIETLFSANFLRGDVNLDGDVNASDAAEILMYCAAVGSGESPALPDDEWLDRADWDQNSDLDAGDAAGVLVYAAEHGAGGTD